MNKDPNNEQNIHNENATVEIQNNIQGSSNTVNINYTATKESELQDYNFPKPIDSFNGREDEFKQLDDYLFLEDKKMVVIWGLPSFGKSELLKEFARRSKLNSKIKYICWIQASNRDTLKHSLQDLVKILKLPEVDELRVLLQIVRNRYQNSETLFVFDDVDMDSSRSLLDWETPSSCKTMFSSKFGEWDTWPNPLLSRNLGPLECDAAVAVLQHKQDPAVITNPNLYTLAKLLDNAPLALQLAAAYIREMTPFNLLNYINKLRKSLDKFVDEQLPAHTFLPYEYCIQEAMNLSLEKIRNLKTFESNLALDILNILAYLDPYAIREETVLEFSFIKNKLEKGDEDEERNQVRRALHVLKRYSFVNLEDGFVKIHSLVQHTILFYHNKPNANMESYYTSCLEYALNNNFSWHLETIFKQADKKFETFKKFYDEYKYKIIYKYKGNSDYKRLPSGYNIIVKTEDSRNISYIPTQLRGYIKYGDDIEELVINSIMNSILNGKATTFLEKLVRANAEKCLIIIFDELASQAEKVIIDHQLLFDAIDSRETKMIKLLQKYEKDIFKKSSARDFYILLHFVVRLNLDELNLILEHSNIDANVRNDVGHTCICHLVLCHLVLPFDTGDVICQMMSSLVNHGASVHNVTDDGCSLLHVAAIWIHNAMQLKVMEFIVDDLHVDVNWSNIHGHTALHIILHRQVMREIDDELMSKVVDVLLTRGASVHVKDNVGESPLNIITKFKFRFHSLMPIESYSQPHDEN